jgi:hypothetical protein
MTETTQLRLASIAFAVAWTSAMWWTNRPQHAGELLLLAACGALAGISWYFGYGRWLRSGLRTR